MKKILLASQSPRRQQLLSEIGFELELCPQDVDETIDPTLSPSENVATLAQRKGESALNQVGLDTSRSRSIYWSRWWRQRWRGNRNRRRRSADGALGPNKVLLGATAVTPSKQSNGSTFP